MKYLFQPMPKFNPYQKEQFNHPYIVLEKQTQNQAQDEIQKCPYGENLLEQPILKIFCDSCKKEMTHHVKTITGSKNYCIGCFSNLQQMPNQYSIEQKLDFALFQSAWSAYHEVLLLQSIQKWGFGNWKQIKDYMQYFGAKFTQDQIQTHYNTYYLQDTTFSPKFSQNLLQRKKQRHLSKPTNNQVSVASLTTTNNTQDHLHQQNLSFKQIDDFSNSQPVCTHTQQKLFESLNQLDEEKNNYIKGYNPKRKEFQVQFDQNAEKVIANLEFRQDDLEEQRKIKYQLLEEYNFRLKKRHEISDFIIEQKLLDKKYQEEWWDQATDHQKSVYHEIKKLRRFCSSLDQWNELVKRLAMQRQLKDIIEGLRSFRCSSNTGKLKQVMQNIRQKIHYQQFKRQSGYPLLSYSPKKQFRGKPRKIIHVDTTTGQQILQTNADDQKYLKNKQNQNKNNRSKSNSKEQTDERLLKKLSLKMPDLKQIVKICADKHDGDQFKYKKVQVKVIDKK